MYYSKKSFYERYVYHDFSIDILLFDHYSLYYKNFVCLVIGLDYLNTIFLLPISISQKKNFSPILHADIHPSLVNLFL